MPATLSPDNLRSARLDAALQALFSASDEQSLRKARVLVDRIKRLSDDDIAEMVGGEDESETDAKQGDYTREDVLANILLLVMNRIFAGGDGVEEDVGEIISQADPEAVDELLEELAGPAQYARVKVGTPGAVWKKGTGGKLEGWWIDATQAAKEGLTGSKPDDGTITPKLEPAPKKGGASKKPAAAKAPKAPPKGKPKKPTVEEAHTHVEGLFADSSKLSEESIKEAANYLQALTIPELHELKGKFSGLKIMSKARKADVIDAIAKRAGVDASGKKVAKELEPEPSIEPEPTLTPEPEPVQEMPTDTAPPDVTTSAPAAAPSILDDPKAWGEAMKARLTPATQDRDLDVDMAIGAARMGNTVQAQDLARRVEEALAKSEAPVKVTAPTTSPDVATPIPPDTESPPTPTPVPVRPANPERDRLNNELGEIKKRLEGLVEPAQHSKVIRARAAMDKANQNLTNAQSEVTRTTSDLQQQEDVYRAGRATGTFSYNDLLKQSEKIKKANRAKLDAGHAVHKAEQVAAKAKTDHDTISKTVTDAWEIGQADREKLTNVRARLVDGGMSDSPQSLDDLEQNTGMDRQELDEEIQRQVQAGAIDPNSKTAEGGAGYRKSTPERAAKVKRATKDLEDSKAYLAQSQKGLDNASRAEAAHWQAEVQAGQSAVDLGQEALREAIAVPNQPKPPTPIAAPLPQQDQNYHAEKERLQKALAEAETHLSDHDDPHSDPIVAKAFENWQNAFKDWQTKKTVYDAAREELQKTGLYEKDARNVWYASQNSWNQSGKLYLENPTWIKLQKISKRKRELDKKVPELEKIVQEAEPLAHATDAAYFKAGQDVLATKQAKQSAYQQAMDNLNRHVATNANPPSAAWKTEDSGAGSSPVTLDPVEDLLEDPDAYPGDPDSATGSEKHTFGQKVGRMAREARTAHLKWALGLAEKELTKPLPHPDTHAHPSVVAAEKKSLVEVPKAETVAAQAQAGRRSAEKFFDQVKAGTPIDSPMYKRAKTSFDEATQRETKAFNALEAAKNAPILANQKIQQINIALMHKRQKDYDTILESLRKVRRAWGANYAKDSVADRYDRLSRASSRRGDRAGALIYQRQCREAFAREIKAEQEAENRQRHRQTVWRYSKSDDFHAYADLLAGTFNALEESGMEVPDSQVEKANDELDGSGWELHYDGTEWSVVVEEGESEGESEADVARTRATLGKVFAKTQELAEKKTRQQALEAELSGKTETAKPVQNRKRSLAFQYQRLAQSAFQRGDRASARIYRKQAAEATRRRN